MPTNWKESRWCRQPIPSWLSRWRDGGPRSETLVSSNVPGGVQTPHGQEFRNWKMPTFSSPNSPERPEVTTHSPCRPELKRRRLLGTERDDNPLTGSLPGPQDSPILLSPAPFP